jgi:hypothetical protein
MKIPRYFTAGGHCRYSPARTNTASRRRGTTSAHQCHGETPIASRPSDGARAHREPAARETPGPSVPDRRRRGSRAGSAARDRLGPGSHATPGDTGGNCIRCGAAVPQHERGPGQCVLQRRHRRGPDCRARPDRRAARRLPSLILPLPRSGRRPDRDRDASPRTAVGLPMCRTRPAPESCSTSSEAGYSRSLSSRREQNPCPAFPEHSSLWRVPHGVGRPAEPRYGGQDALGPAVVVFAIRCSPGPGHARTARSGWPPCSDCGNRPTTTGTSR